jgi:hypothetical protein
MKRVLAGVIAVITILTTTIFAQVRELPSPANTGSAMPNLTVSPDGKVYLSWIERLDGGRASLRFAVREGNGWSAPRVIAEGANWFVNWADFPSLIALKNGRKVTLAAHWLVKSSPETFDYDVHISRSFDGGQTWEKPFIPHRDGVRAEHGFVSLAPASDGELAAVWLDGREMKTGGTTHDQGHGGHGNMTLRYVRIRRNGRLTEEAVLDRRVCECCQTAMAMTADGPVVAYRDRSEDRSEIRDISITRLRNGRWTTPRSVAADNWELTGCPVNGPAIAARGRQVAVAWYTAAGNRPRIRLAFSNDSGESFGEPITIDDGNPIGRVDLQLLDDGRAVVCWLEKMPDGGKLLLRRVGSDGKPGGAVTIAPSGTARSNGFPQMVRVGNRLTFAWTGPKVLTAEYDLDQR